MKKIDASDPLARSLDVTAENLDRLNELFPEAFTEGKVDFDVLSQLLGGAVDDGDEKYGLNWHGKRRARQLALTPSTGTLRPCPEESVDWDTTQNLMIEGDNLEVLKLLQKSYAGKVKLIYIDPPYNTGKDFVYRDNYRDNIRNYLELTGQIDGGGGGYLSSNPETSGRFHTAWLNMMYPRLKLARSLLRNDGAILVSIDDKEVPNLRLVMDDLFGSENFIAEIVWEGTNKNDARQIGICHEYVAVYARNREAVNRDWRVKKKGVSAVLREVARLKDLHGSDHQTASDDLAGWFRANKAKAAYGNRRFRNIDCRGAYKEDDPTAPGGRRFELRNPLTGASIPLRRNRGWSFDQETFDRLVHAGRITFVSDTSVMVRRYLHEIDRVTPPSVLYQPARSASERLNRTMGATVFDHPKDESVIAEFVQMVIGNEPDSIVMDFFAGSGTTGHSVMKYGLASNLAIRYVLVQLPEPLDPERPATRRSAEFCDSLGKQRNVAELTKERLRKCAAKLRQEKYSGADGDLGFRVFKLDRSNIRSWNSKPEDLESELLVAIDHIEPDRTEQDLLYELLLKLGLDLCAPIQTRAIGGSRVHAVGAGTLFACLEEKVLADEYEALATGIADWHDEIEARSETTVVFRDSAFANDVTKANVTAILEQRGLSDVRSL